MTARGGRRNGIYTSAVPLNLANPCPKCEAERGRKCLKKVGEQWLPRTRTHPERPSGRKKANT